MQFLLCCLLFVIVLSLRPVLVLLNHHQEDIEVSNKKSPSSIRIPAFAFGEVLPLKESRINASVFRKSVECLWGRHAFNNGKQEDDSHV
jgi:hypothetical protein